MKFLLVLAVLLVAYGIWRANRRERDDAPPRAPARQAPQQLEMVRCAVCGVHLPRNDALSTARASYCSAEHRQQAEP